MKIDLTGKIEGRYLVSVVQKDGTERFPLGKKFRKNLVLNSGLDLLFNSGAVNLGFGNVFLACRAGTGNTAPNVADTVLVNQVNSTNSYLTTTGACGSSSDTATSSRTHKRTFNFNPEVANVNYNELGWSNSVSAAANLYSRVVLGSTVTVQTGESLRVVYQQRIVMAQATTQSSVTLSSGSFSGNGNIKVVGTFIDLFGTINSNGSETAANAPLLLGRLGPAWLLQNSSFPAINVGLTPSYSGINATDSQSANASGTYTAGQFRIDLTYVWSAAVPATTVTNVRSFLFGAIVTLVGTGFQWLLNANQTKANTASLTLVLRIAWTRV